MVFLLKAFSRLPFSVLYLFAKIFYFLAYYIVGYRKKVVYENISNAFPEKNEAEVKKIVRQFYDNLSQVIVEIIKLLTLSGEEAAKRAILKNENILYDYIEKGQSVLVLSGHQCNWEYLFIGSSAHLKMPVDGVYKKMNNLSFEKLMFDTRARFGGNPVEINQTFRHLVKNRNIPRCFSMLGDQTPMLRGDNNLWMTFLRQDLEVPFYMGGSQIAKKFEMPVVFVGMKRTKKGFYEITIEKISEPPYPKDGFEIIEIYRDKMENLIKESPADWLWSHKRWKRGREISK